jgi:hypothetical protein
MAASRALYKRVPRGISIGIKLPIYQKNGMLFALSSDGTVEVKYDLNGLVEGLDLTPIRTLVERVAGRSAPQKQGV